MNNPSFDGKRRSPGGRRAGGARGTEPGFSYFTALGRWNEFANISRTELAKRVGLSTSALSELLTNTGSDAATLTALNRAIEIIKACGGTEEDIENWAAFHGDVIKHLAGVIKGLPSPPVPGQTYRSPLASLTPEGWLRSMSERCAAKLDVSSSHGVGSEQHRLSTGLYVRRTQQDAIANMLRPGGYDKPILVHGPVGEGKSSLLWGLYQELKNNSELETYLLDAPWLAPDSGVAIVSVDDLRDVADQAATRDRVAVFLIDTVDLLLYDEPHRHQVLAICALLTELGAEVLLTSRPEEALTVPQASFVQVGLLPYDDVELPQAIDKHIAVFCPHALRGEANDTTRLMVESAARGRSVDETALNPLTLRLLFELHEPNFPSLKRDVSRLYEKYWKQRARTDQPSEVRTGHQTDFSLPVGHTAVGKVFISYRRRGPQALAAAKFAERLVANLGPDRVFIDTQVRAGERYPDELKTELAASDVVVAVIHDGWVAAFAEQRTDWTRQELSAALHAGKKVIPVLLDQAPQPGYEEVPADVAEIARSLPIPLRLDHHYEPDLAHLTAAVEQALALPEVPLAVADLKGDVPDRPRLRLALHVLGFGVLFAVLTLPIAAELGLPVWQTLMSAGYATLLAMLALTVGVILFAAMRRWLDAMSRRHQEQSLVESVKNRWPGYAVFLLVLTVIWLPMLGMRQLNAQLRLLLTGLMIIFLARTIQLQVRKVRQIDTAWPPLVSPDTLAFRRASKRLHARLTADQPPHDRAWQRQAESVYLALAEVRATLEQRAQRTWLQWLTGSRHNALVLATGGAFTSTAGLTATGLAIHLASGNIRPNVLLIGATVPAVALALTLVVFTACFLLDRSSIRQQVQELNAWDTRLCPLIYPGNP